MPKKVNYILISEHSSFRLLAYSCAFRACRWVVFDGGITLDPTDPPKILMPHTILYNYRIHPSMTL